MRYDWLHVGVCWVHTQMRCFYILSFLFNWNSSQCKIKFYLLSSSGVWFEGLTTAIRSMISHAYCAKKRASWPSFWSVLKYSWNKFQTDQVLKKSKTNIFSLKREYELRLFRDWYLKTFLRFCGFWSQYLEYDCSQKNEYYSRILTL